MNKKPKFEQLTRKIPKKLFKEILVAVIGILVIWFGIWAAFGTQNPFYVVASGSMMPELEVYDVVVIEGHSSIEDVQIGDIIVFQRPSGHDRVILHRVVSITDDDPITLRTKGDNNISSIPGTDYPITEKEYIGKAEFVIPQMGYLTQIMKPPLGYFLGSWLVIIPIILHFKFKGEQRKKE